MANFDEDIRRITNEVLQDGTVDQIIREKVTDGIKGAISDSFGYGKLRNAIKERVEQVLVGNSVPNSVGNDVVIDCENAPNTPLSSSIYKNININTKINTKSNPILSGEENGTEENPPPTEQVYEELIKQNIDYDSLVISRSEDKPLIDEIVELILETVLSGRERIQIAGDLRPAGMVKQRLLKLNNSHIDYVLHCFYQNTADIQNMKQYLLAMLFNAPVTMNGYWQAKVQHDMG